MSYRDEILEYVGDCLQGIQKTVDEPRVKALGSEDLQVLHDELQLLAGMALTAAREAKKDKAYEEQDHA